MMRVPASTAKILRGVPLPDEVAVTHTKAVVLDMGAYSTRLGFAGDTAPRMNERTVVLHRGSGSRGSHAHGSNNDNNNNNSAPALCFDEAYTAWHGGLVKASGPRDGHSVQSQRNAAAAAAADGQHANASSSPLSSHEQQQQQLVHVVDKGTVADWDAYEALLQRIDDMLQLSNTTLAAPLLVTEKALVPPTQRQRIAELLFEQHNLTALSFSLCPVLALYAAGLCTGVSVELGHDQCHVVPVYQGFGLFHAMHCMPFGGHALTQAMALASARGGQLPATVVHPHRQHDVWAHLKHAYARTLPSHDAYTAMTAATTAVAAAAAAHNAQAHVDTALATEAAAEAHDATMTAAMHSASVQHRLPDGTVLHVGAERYLPSEALFYPTLLPSHLYSVVDQTRVEQAVQLHTAAPSRGVHELVVDAVRRCDADLTPQLYEHVLLSGGSSLLAQLPQRLEAEVQAALYQQQHSQQQQQQHRQQQQQHEQQALRVRVRADAERRDAAFVGGSILASLPSFQQLWVRRADYDEAGATAVLRGCI